MSRTVILAGYAFVAVAAVACQLAALVSPRIPTLGQAVSVLVRRRAGRWLALGLWLWTGWHLFVRSNPGG
ncbi:MAG: DUF6186 family protein [Actinomycetota bacterium]|nr:DUF6186 family protein [Actinomycetota bacterium]